MNNIADRVSESRKKELERTNTVKENHNPSGRYKFWSTWKKNNGQSIFIGLSDYKHMLTKKGS